MKKIITIVLAVCPLLFLNSCGTIGSAINHGKREIFMDKAPKDLVVTSAGKKLDVHYSVYKSHTSRRTRGNITTSKTNTISYPAVTVARKKRATLEFYSPSWNKKATVELKPKVNWAIFAGDWFLTANFGLLIDIPTGNLKEVYPNFISVDGLLK